MRNAKTDYRPDIDGLRALAVIAVILYHFKIGFVPGGFVGVDIFFVISGYLITQVIMTHGKKPNLANFYFRRIRRLIPALLATVIITYLTAFLMFSPSDFKLMSGSAVSAATGVSNIFFWMESGYFDAASSLKPLLHTWSLGVEIQFYLVWPMLLMAITRLTNKPWLVIVALLLIGAGVSYVYLRTDASGAFFLMPFRFHEFLFGSLVVFLERGRLAQWLADSAYLLGLALIAYSLFTLSGETTLFPGLAALVPVTGTALMILGGEGSRLAKPFSSALAVSIGKISYSLYLVHWPIMVFTSYALLDQITTAVKFGLVGATILLALALYYLIEKPLRHRGNSTFSDKKFSIGTSLASIALVAAATSSWAQEGWGWRVPAEVRDVAKIDPEAASLYVFGLIKTLNQREHFDPSSSKQKILIIGDSQAGDLLNILNEQGYASKYDIVARLVDSACATPGLGKDEERDFYTRVNPIVIKDPAYLVRCQDSLKRVDDQVLMASADKIFIAFYWRDFAERYYTEAIAKIALGSRADVYVFGRKDLLKDSAFITSTHGRTAGLNRYAFKYRNPETDTINKPLASMKGIRYVDMMQATCPNNEECHVLDSNNRPVFFNATHLSKEGAILYGAEVVNLINSAQKR
jgi:peptidoglycan/LPS O-acetylase OafA/YrhL